MSLIRLETRNTRNKVIKHTFVSFWVPSIQLDHLLRHFVELAHSKIRFGEVELFRFAECLTQNRVFRPESDV